MYALLAGMRVVEGAAFVAAPLCCQHLLQMGAEVIRFDMIGGGPDYHRWPRVSGGGASLYWEGLNKGKKSVAIDLAKPEGRELAVAIATAPGEGAGLFVTNYPVDGFLSHENLVARRADMISVRVMGWADGTNAVDYTVNSALGIPYMTGPEKLAAEPVNHALPAWDIATGNYAAFALLAAERRRARTGRGEEVRVPLGNIAMSTLGHLGQIAEVSASGEDRPRVGNDIFGAFGRDFETADGRRVMIVALTRRQWKSLVETLGVGDEIAAIEREIGLDLAADEGLRFEHRERLNPIVAGAIAKRTLGDLDRVFAGTAVCWATYNTLKQAIGTPGLIEKGNAMFSSVRHAGGQTYLTPGAAAELGSGTRRPAGQAPRLGEHTEEVLANVLHLPGSEIGRLHDAGIVHTTKP
jgi:2-methylfumaryl-CoA isomerase